MARVALGLPWPSAIWGCVAALLDLHGATTHDVEIWGAHEAVGNFDELWCRALNAAERGEIDYYVSLHADTAPVIKNPAFQAPDPDSGLPGINQWIADGLFLDKLVDRLAARPELSLISAAIAIKDFRGVMSCGVGDPDPAAWSPQRRVTATELDRLPDDFGLEELQAIGFPAGPLAHNNGLWAANLTDKRWFETYRDGSLVCSFQFPRRSYKHPKSGLWVTAGQSEDWLFSLRAAQLGIKSCFTKRVKIAHRGTFNYLNWGGWGQFKVDEDLRTKWDVPREPSPRTDAGVCP